jgi:hypothetical protein
LDAFFPTAIAMGHMISALTRLHPNQKNLAARANTTLGYQL